MHRVGRRRAGLLALHPPARTRASRRFQCGGDHYRGWRAGWCGHNRHCAITPTGTLRVWAVDGGAAIACDRVPGCVRGAAIGAAYLMASEADLFAALSLQ